MTSAAGQESRHCNFCGKRQFEVNILVAAATAAICNECIDLCLEIARQTEAAARITANRQRYAVAETCARPATENTAGTAAP